MRLAITSGSRIIILFDSPDDWEEISKCVAEEKRIKDNNQSNSSNGRSMANVDRIKLDENSPIEMTDIEVQELGSEITMAVESEETDATKESVLTWLRIAIDSKSVNSSCRKYSIDGEYERDVRDVKRSRSTAEESQEGSFAEKPSPHTVNIITDNITDNTSGYRVALIRFSGWVRGSAPQGRLWDGFWKLYTR